MSQSRTADYWIETLDMEKHREGGYYVETYESDVRFPAEGLPEGYSGDRASGSSIYYLLTTDDFSAFHKMRSDELWHFYEGDPITLYLLEDDGVRTVRIGDEQFQTVVPGDTWFAGEIVSGDAADGYALVGCDVTPAFEYADYELATKELAKEFDDQAELIHRLTR